MSEVIANSAADKVFRSEYTDPQFWLDGKYKDFATDTIKYLPIGEEFIKWYWELSNHTITDFAQEMVAILSIPQNATREQFERHAHGRPREMFGMRGTIPHCADCDPNDLKHLSPKAREQMVRYTETHPFLLEVLKEESLDDFDIYDVRYLKKAQSVDDLIMVGKMPGDKFKYWQKYFPTLVDKIYEKIEYDAKGEVISYQIRSFSPEYIRINNKK